MLLILLQKFEQIRFNFFNSSSNNLGTSYIFQEEHENLNENAAAATFSILYSNIRSMKKFRKLQTIFLSSFSFDFRIICFSET